MSKQVFESEFVGEVGVDSGHIELGDVGEVQLELPTRLGDGIYSVTEIKVNGSVRGYWVNVDACEEWAVTGIEGLDVGPDRPRQVAKKDVLKLPAKKAVRKTATA